MVRRPHWQCFLRGAPFPRSVAVSELKQRIETAEEAVLELDNALRASPQHASQLSPGRVRQHKMLELEKRRELRANLMRLQLELEAIAVDAVDIAVAQGPNKAGNKATNTSMDREKSNKDR